MQDYPSFRVVSQVGQEWYTTLDIMIMKEYLNCQSEVTIFEQKMRKHHNFTLTKVHGIYRCFKISGARGSSHY